MNNKVVWVVVVILVLVGLYYWSQPAADVSSAPVETPAAESIPAIPAEIEVPVAPVQ